MDMHPLGSKGPQISVVGYGAWEAGGDMWGPQDDDQVVEAMQAALDAGMTWIDSAEVYGRGHSEELVGRAVAGRDRDSFRVFTKVGAKPGGSGYRPEEVHAAIRKSLGQLGLDHVDLYQIHWPNETEAAVEATWEAMAEIQDAGLARWIGVSNFGRDLIERCEPIRHVDSVQNRFSLLHVEDRERLLPYLREIGTGFLAYSPLGLGLLTGAITAEHRFHAGDFRGGGGAEERRPEDFRPGRFEQNLARVEELKAVAERVGLAPGVLALRWVIEQDGVSGAIAGSRNPKHVRANAEAGSLRVDPGVLQELERIFGWAS